MQKLSLIKILFTCFIILLLIPIVETGNLYAQQTWQWGIRGNDNDPNSPVPGDDNIIDMATDPNGNIYTLTKLYAPGQGDINGLPISGYGYYDMLISSFDCQGALRWHKVIGGNYTDDGLALRTDTIGGVYVLGSVFSMNNGGVHISSDTTIFPGYKQSLLLKYDTSGNFNWLRLPQPDTLSSYNLLNLYTMDVDGNGDIFVLGTFTPGSYADGALIVNDTSTYILKYNNLGAVIGSTKMEISSTNFPNYAPLGNSYLKMDFARKRYYLAGKFETYQSSYSLTFGNTAITHGAYFGCFDENGISLFVKQSTHPLYGDGFTCRPAIDELGNIYLTGSTYPSDSWGGFTFNNSLSNSNMPILIAMDTNGNNIWATNASTNGATGSKGIKYTNNTVGIIGQFPGTLKWDNFQLTNDYNQSYDISFARFNAQTGAIIGLDSLKSNFGYADFATGLETDKNGNFYLAGRLSGQLYVADDTLNISGSGYDWFLAKFGSANCNCTVPSAHFSQGGTTSGTDVILAYDGSMPIDSVSWEFGDGGHGSGNSITHHYAQNGSYTICVTAYNDCGNNTYCQTINTSGNSINDIPGFADISIYPNPSTGILNLKGLTENLQYHLYSSLGSLVLKGTLSAPASTVDMAPWASGWYVLELQNGKGDKQRVKVLKD